MSTGRFIIVRDAGSITTNVVKTGLTSGTSYDFRLVLRNDIATVQRNYSGTNTVTKS